MRYMHALSHQPEVVNAGACEIARLVRWRCRFDRFKVYVSGREESLKRTFESLDLDHDGRLTASEVEAGLSNFAFTCPFSRCVYRTKQQVHGGWLPCDLPATLRSTMLGRKQHSAV